MPDEALQVVFRSVVVGRLLYASYMRGAKILEKANGITAKGGRERHISWL